MLLPSSCRCPPALFIARAVLIVAVAGPMAMAMAIATTQPSATLTGTPPFRPGSDAQVLATVPARSTDPRARELAVLRQAWRAQPQDLGTALRLAQRCFDEVAAEGDPRWLGCTQAALQPWWTQAAPPPAVRLLRAQLLQFDHRFNEALADLDGALRQEPTLGAAWAWRTAILMVQANYTAARQSCQQMAPWATRLVAAACMAQVDAATGRAAPAAARLREALANETAPARAQAQTQAQTQAENTRNEERLWALTRLAETEERLGHFSAAEAAFVQALALGVPDVYLQAAYADFLLDRQRPAEVLALLKGRASADVLLLRLALAALTARDRSAPALKQQLADRFAAAGLRGDNSHQKEESRFALALQGDTARALQLAQQNFAVQREPADARILLEAAVAARQPAAAQPVLDWMAASGIESVALQALAAQLKTPPKAPL